MDEKKTIDDQIVALQEELANLRREYQQIIEQFQGQNVLQKDAQLSTSERATTSTEDLEKKLECFRRIIGNYHPTETSPTYADLHALCQQLKEKLQNSDNTLQKMQYENHTLQARLNSQEVELMTLRQTRSISTSGQTPAASHVPTPTQKKRCIWRWPWKQSVPTKDLLLPLPLQMISYVTSLEDVC